MKTLQEIKYLFEHKNYSVRMDFIDDYHFEDDYFDYYKSFIIDAKDVKNPLYLSDLIDLAAWLEIFEPELYERYTSYLFEKRHFVVKLAALDYMLSSDLFYEDKDVNDKLEKFILNTRQRGLINQALVNAIVLTQSEKKCELLIDSLSKTNDWRSIYRTLRQLERISLLSFCKDKIYNHIISLHTQKDFGKGVEQLLSTPPP